MDKNNNAVWEKYSKTTHFIGRLVSAITVIMLVGAPFLIGKYLGAFPDIGAVGKAFFSVGLVWTVSSVAEFLIYTPMLGSGGGFLRGCRAIKWCATGTRSNSPHCYSRYP